jgi:hypothetical protein
MRRPCARATCLLILTVRRFSAQDRSNALRAIKQPKAEASDRETGLAAEEIAASRLLLTGNPGGWTVTNIGAGDSGGNSFGARLALAVAERLCLGYLQVWCENEKGRVTESALPRGINVLAAVCVPRSVTTFSKLPPICQLLRASPSWDRTQFFGHLP